MTSSGTDTDLAPDSENIMALFARRHNDQPFWRIPPFQTENLDVLYQHGINCVTSSDGKGMMSTGWALWDRAGLLQYQAKDFLQDGYREWANTSPPADERVAFLTDMFNRLIDIYPEIDTTSDVWSLPRQVAEPASQLYGARCWAGSELLETAPPAGLMTDELEEAIYRAFDGTHPAFMPPRTIGQFDALRKNRGLGS
jgi:hypothetical protein